MRHRSSIARGPLGLLAFVLVLGLATACGGGGGGTGTLAVGITDAPFPVLDGCVSAAVIEIDGVSARSPEGGWTDMALVGSAGDSVEIDLLDLRAGLSENLALGEVPAGAYGEIRLHVVSARIEFGDGSPAQSFKIPSGMSSGLKLKIDPPLLLASGGTANLLIDVNLAESFHTTGLGGEPTCDDLKAGETMVIFSPVVRVVNTDTSGLVTGLVLDDQGTPLGDVEVTAFPAGTVLDADSEPVAATFSAPAGLEGVAEGTYALYLEPGSYDLYVRAPDAETRELAAGGVTVAEGELITGQNLVVPSAP